MGTRGRIDARNREGTHGEFVAMWVAGTLGKGLPCTWARGCLGVATCSLEVATHVGLIDMQPNSAQKGKANDTCVGGAKNRELGQRKGHEARRQ